MGRQRKAWLWGRDGKRTVNGRILPGVYVRFYDYTPDGTRINRSKRFLNMQEAQTWVSRFNLHLYQKRIDAEKQPRISECAATFLESKTLAPDTHRSYRTALDWLTELTKDAPLPRISSRNIDRFIQQRLAHSSETTVTKHLRSLNVFFRWAIARGHLQTNPLGKSSVRLRSATGRSLPDITEENVNNILRRITTPDQILSVCLAMTTGLSREHITELTTINVDLNKRCLRFLHRKQRCDNCIPVHDLLFPLLAKRLNPTHPHARILKGIERHRIKERDWWRVTTAETGLEGLRFRDLYSWANANQQSVSRILKKQAKY